jgi:uncharacterized protein
MDIGNNWDKIRSIFNEAFGSCCHYALTTVNDDGSPHVTPIGGLVLREDRTGFYFDEYCTRTRENLRRDPRVCILAVNADRTFWGKSLAAGKFLSPPAVRLIGTAGEMRQATDDEIAAFKKRISYASGTKGYDLLWAHLHTVRDLSFDSFEPVETGEMTHDLWL